MIRVVLVAGMLGAAVGCGSSSTGGASAPKMQTTPTITWTAPASIVYGTALSATQLDATASVAGSFTYSPALGAVPLAGTQTLTVSFTPSDTADYTSAQATVSLVVTKATPTISWTPPAVITYGTALSSTQLDATASVPGTLVYSPAAGTTLVAGTGTLSVTFTPTDSVDYNTGQASVPLVVSKATPVISWAVPAAITYGTALSGTQLNATSSASGSLAYSPVAGTVESAGPQTLSVTLTPTDTADYNPASTSVPLVVDKALPTISWAAPASIASGASVTATQLNATSPVAGSFVYAPAAGTQEIVQGALTLQTIFTPTDTNDYLTATATNTLQVTPPSGTPTYNWTSVTINAGGFTDGLYFHPKQQGLLYAKMDIADAYRFNTTTNQWVSLLNWIDRSQGNYFHTDYAVGALALDPTDANYLYLAVGIGLGTPAVTGNLLISHDQGNTFTNVALPFAVQANSNGREGGERLVVDPNLPSRLYFGTQNAGLWYSNNRGLTWTQSTTFPALGTANAQGISFVLPVAASGTSGSLTPVLFAGVAESTTGGVLNTLYVSTNAGTTWTPFNGQISGSLLPIRGRLGPSQELYVTYDNAIGPSGITLGMICAYTYTNAGAVGAPRNITPTLTAGTTAGFVDIEPDPSTPGALITATIDGSLTVGGVAQDYIYRSTDDGNTWTSFVNDTHNLTPTPWVTASLRNHDGDWINLAVDPFNSKHVVYGTGEMIFATNDITAAGGAVSWYEQAVGEEEHNVISLAAPPSGPTLLYSGLHDHNGMPHASLTVAPQRYPAPNTNMTSSLAYAENNPLIVARVGGNKDYTATAAPYGAVSSDAGNTWTIFANTPLPNSASGDGAIAVSADGTTLVWAPYDVAPVYSTNQGQTWTLCAGAPSPSKKVVADHINTNMFYMSSMTYESYPTTTTGGSLYVSVDEGKSFNPVAGTSGLPAGDVYANFAIAGDVWLVAPYYGLYRNTGTASSIAMSKVGAFTGAYHMAFGAPKPGSGYTYSVYVDGDIGGVDGIYRSTDGGNTWQLITDQQHQFGYLNVMEADRRIFGTVYLGPGGRGVIWGTSTY